ncbi:MAG TPA: S1 RNA-binding domain-containing protein [Anaerolineales bacterium]|nr:S1 RNA-binding domain-containing protein [Anaerolineales bacterium]HMV96346.1 S1 RNA-binding domain-containing protein [Anaerolineales bacterium]HMX20329.1 S1 RNA-binding domain-containing protein [Anaerolineales bacterium]HMX75260.1 S1 RNA-binding domain-containing protein [Anaerolineales bacterium]HMZ44206.1 S1 RNA-binding domain-containing protein [Anaerolineales bacterium]
MTTPDSAPAVALEPKTKLSGKILKTTLAGALVDIGQSLPGVIHISQLQQDAVNKVEDVVKEGQTVEVWVRRVKKDRIELTMIEPLGYEWKEIVPDMTVKGKVVRIETYGAFVDFGAERPGLIHVSELTHGYVKTAGEVVKEGDEVEAKVLDVDRRKRQIRLSMKALLPEIVEEEKPEREERSKKGDKPKGKKGKKQEEEAYEMEVEVSNEPQFTAMQIAWQQALERSKGRGKVRTKSYKSASDEKEELFNRTLEKRASSN